MTRRRRSLAGALALVGGGALALTAVVAVFADGGNLDVQVPDRTGYAVDYTNDNAKVEYLGDQNTTFGSSGSGIFDSFVRLQAEPDEEGFNTDAKPELDTKAGAFTHSILVSDIPVIGIDGVPHWELFADINDSDNTPLITLNELEIYFTDDPDLVGYPFTGTAVKKYDFDGEIRINDVNQGSGRGDLRYSIPLTGITIPAECGYKNPACDTYFVLYSHWGAASGDYTSDGGFEEWKVKQYPYVVVSKTATPSFTRTHTWTIDKAVTPASHSFFDGQSAPSTYTITLDKTTVDSAWAVAGTIAVNNPGTETAVISSVSDVVSGAGGGAASVSCGVTFPYSLPKNQTLNCTYTKSLTNADTRTNTATATLNYGGLFTGTASVDFTGVSPTVVGYDSINVDDTNNAGDRTGISVDTSYTYSRTFDCTGISYTGGVGSTSYPNTATITQTSQSDNASVGVTCYRLSVTKDATPAFTRTHTWTIDKSVAPDSHSFFDGQSGTSTYTIALTKTTVDSGWSVSGNITVNNPAPMAATIGAVTDSMTGGINATVDCGGATSVPATGSLVCTYSASLPNADTRTNTASVTAYTIPYSGTASVNFASVSPTVVGYPTINVDDTNAGGDAGPISSSTSYTYTRTFDCTGISYTGGTGSTSYPNTATITETSQSDNASVGVTCYRLSVSKTAATTYDRDYTWTIDKSANTSEVTLDQGETTSVGYSVTVTASAPNDSNFAVSGNITISNPAPMPATVDTLTDDISGLAGDPTPSCPSSTVPAGGSLVCTYSSSLPNADARTNTATATAYGVSYPSNAAPITFGAPTTVTDECVTVTDSLQGELGTVCANESPKTWTYNRTVGPYATCGDFNVRNTASFVTNDTGATGSDSWDVLVHVIGCGNLFHTGTTCEQYYMGAPPVGLAGQGIEAVEYSVKSSLIKQVNPGVFFYYNDVTATGGSITLTVNQIPPGGYNQPMAVHQGQVLVYDENCRTYSNFSFTTANGDVQLTINGTTAGHDYIFSVKYTPANLVGLAPPATSPVTYDWQTEFNGISGQDSLDFVKKSGALSTTTLSTALTPTATVDTTSDVASELATTGDASEQSTVETSHGQSADHPLPQGNGNGNGKDKDKDK